MTKDLLLVLSREEGEGALADFDTSITRNLLNRLRRR
jgi:hypothetical protein